MIVHFRDLRFSHVSRSEVSSLASHRVIVLLQHGLGNQMFQYAAGYALAKRLGWPLELECNVFHGQPPERQYQLGLFGISGKVRPLSTFFRQLWRCAINARPSAWPLRMPAQWLLQVDVVRDRHWCRFDPSVFEQRINRSLCLLGYWQSPRYFEDCAEEIRSELTFTASLDPANREILSQIQDSLSVSLHIRRGDFLHVKGNAVLNMDYYQRAIKLVMEHHPQPHFFVFSDDMDWVKQNLPIPAPMTFVEVNNQFTGAQDLRLMSACRHHIIANSSFSWWGAWLNPSPDKLVLAPRRTVEENGSTDPFPHEWIVC